jgi:Resolvase, N terminal domain
LRGADVLTRFTEVESGRKANRTELLKALHLAKVTGATLVIAKLDQLSRNAAFLLELRDSGVPGRAVWRCVQQCRPTQRRLRRTWHR